MPEDFEIRIKADPSQALAGANQASEALKNLGDTGSGAANKITQDTAKATFAKKELREAVKGLSLQFPLLGRVAALALNPISILVASITGAFSLFRLRVDELTTTLAGLKLPDVSTDQIARIRQATEAWQAFNETMSKAVQNYASVESASGRVLQMIAAETDQKKQLLAAEKALELSRLEAMKTRMPAGDYALARTEIENRYAAAGLALETTSRRKQLEERARRVGNQIIEARRKAAEAAGITVGSAEGEAEVEREMRKQAEAASEDLKRRQERLGDLAEMRSSRWQRLWRAPQFYLRYGLSYTGSEARQLEEEAAERDRVIIQRYQDFKARQPGWAEARARRGRLMSEAGELAGGAFVGQLEVQRDEQSLAREQAAGNLARAMGVVENNNRAAGVLRTEIQQAVRSGDEAVAEMIRALRVLDNRNREAVQEMRRIANELRVLQGQTANLR